MLCFFNDSCVGAVEISPVKAAGVESCGQRRNQKLHAAVARSKFSSQRVQNTSHSERFLKFWCAKIARRCEAHFEQNTSALEHVMKLWCAKIARRCGEKRILKWKCLKNWRCRTTFWTSDVEKLHAAVARSTFASQNAKKLTVSDHFLNCGCRKIARRCGEKHVSESKC